MPVVPWVRPSQGSVQKPANGRHSRPRELLGGRLHQQPDLPVAGVIAERDRPAVRRADAALRARGSGTAGGRARAGPSPCPRSASARRGRRSGRRAASPASAGRLPAGPAPAVWTSSSPAAAMGLPTISSNPIAVRLPCRGLMSVPPRSHPRRRTPVYTGVRLADRLPVRRQRALRQRRWESAAARKPVVEVAQSRGAATRSREVARPDVEDREAADQVRRRLGRPPRSARPRPAPSARAGSRVLDHEALRLLEGHLA